MKIKKNGDTITVVLPCGRKTIISSIDSDLLKIFPIWVYRGGYVCIERSIENDFGCLRQQIYLARAILIKKFGKKTLRHYLVDHADRNKMNNVRSNLRLATTRQNNQNRSGKSNTGFKGVCCTSNHRKLNKKYIAYIGGNGILKSKNLGYYSTAEEAARVYDREAKLRFGEFAYLNFPQEHAVAIASGTTKEKLT